MSEPSRWHFRVEMTRLTRLLLPVTTLFSPILAKSLSVDGIKGLADRLLNGRGGDFEFSLTSEHEPWSRWNQPSNDNYTVSKSENGKIRVQGTTLSALARG